MPTLERRDCMVSFAFRIRINLNITFSQTSFAVMLWLYLIASKFIGKHL